MLTVREGRVRILTDGEGLVALELRDEAGQNALSESLVKELLDVLAQAVALPSIRVLLLLGLPSIFCSGASRDVLERAARGELDPSDLQVAGAMLNVPVPVVAAMEGHALGGGLALGLCADLVVLARESRYGATFMDLGFPPGMGMTRLLEHVLSPAIAHEMLYTGQALKGAELAGRCGFNYILPRAEVRPKALDLAQRISEKPRSSLLLLKATLSGPRRQAYLAASATEVLMQQASFGQSDVRLRLMERLNAE